jgi:hypothetical protein
MDLGSLIAHPDLVVEYISQQNIARIITWANIMGLIGGAFYVASIWMRTVIPLRIAGIVSALFFLLFGVLSGSVPSIFLYAILLPLNIVRLYQMVRLVEKVRLASGRDMAIDWLEPFMTRRKYRAGDVLFEKNDLADEMFLNVRGRYRVTDLGVDIAPGQLFGELGLLTPDHRRTHSVACVEDGEVLTISYRQVLELYFENPEFGFHFLRLSSERLLQNLARLEARLAQQQGAAG